jgi:hypothetical protein
MNLEERRNKAIIECYTIEEICDFFSQFYDMEYEYDREIILKKTLNLRQSDISIRLSSFIRPNTIYDRLVHEILLTTYDRHTPKHLHLEYTTRPDNYDNCQWFIVNYYQSSFVKIKKQDILMSMVDFIIENESKYYKVPIQLKRQLTLDKII